MLTPRHRKWLQVSAARALPVLVLAAWPALPLQAQDAHDQQGLEIAREVARRDSGWMDQQALMTMVLRDRQGRESRRQIRVRTLEVEGDGDRSLTLFKHPADVKGTAFLSVTHALEADQQWLYLPALKRVKRISSANKSGPFMGSEFAYEDLTSQEVEKYHHRWLRDESVDGRTTMVLQRTPRYAHSGYARQVVWVDDRIWRPLKVAFHDRKDAHLKTLSFEDYRQYLGRYWRAHRMTMVNHHSGKSTVLLWSEIRHRTGLTVADFDRNALRRAR